MIRNRTSLLIRAIFTSKAQVGRALPLCAPRTALFSTWQDRGEGNGPPRRRSPPLQQKFNAVKIAYRVGKPMTLNTADVPQVEVKNSLQLKSTSLGKEEQIWGVKTINSVGSKFFSHQQDWMNDGNGSRLLTYLFHQTHEQVLEEYNAHKNQDEFKFMPQYHSKGYVLQNSFQLIMQYQAAKVEESLRREETDSISQELINNYILNMSALTYYYYQTLFSLKTTQEFAYECFERPKLDTHFNNFIHGVFKIKKDHTRNTLQFPLPLSIVEQAMCLKVLRNTLLQLKKFGPFASDSEKQYFFEIATCLLRNSAFQIKFQNVSIRRAPQSIKTVYDDLVNNFLTVLNSTMDFLHEQDPSQMSFKTVANLAGSVGYFKSVARLLHNEKSQSNMVSEDEEFLKQTLPALDRKFTKLFQNYDFAKMGSKVMGEINSNLVTPMAMDKMKIHLLQSLTAIYLDPKNPKFNTYYNNYFLKQQITEVCDSFNVMEVCKMGVQTTSSLIDLLGTLGQIDFMKLQMINQSLQTLITTKNYQVGDTFAFAQKTIQGLSRYFSAHTYDPTIVKFLLEVAKKDLADPEQNKITPVKIRTLVKNLSVSRFGDGGQSDSISAPVDESPTFIDQLTTLVGKHAIDRRGRVDESMIPYVMNRFACQGMTRQYKHLKTVFEKVGAAPGDQQPIGGFNHVNQSKNVLQCLHAFVMMQDYSNTTALEALLHKVLGAKPELNRYSFFEKGVFNRTLAITLKGLELDLSLVDKQQAELYPDIPEVVRQHQISRLETLIGKLRKKIVDPKLLEFQSKEVGSQQQRFYERLIKFCPSIDLEFDDVYFGYPLLGGLTKADVYIPIFDMVIEFDGPAHFVQTELKQDPVSTDNSESEILSRFDGLQDLEPFMMKPNALVDRIVRAEHRKVLRFDYQVHNILYTLQQLRKISPEKVRHFTDRIEEEIRA